MVQLGKEKFTKIDGESVDLQPQLLFQRLIVVGNIYTEENGAESLLKYELAPHPSSMFDNFGMMRSPAKSYLAEALHKLSPSFESSHIIPSFIVYDGGSLLHKTQWKKESSFNNICLQYVDFFYRKHQTQS